MGSSHWGRRSPWHDDVQLFLIGKGPEESDDGVMVGAKQPDASRWTPRCKVLVCLIVLLGTSDYNMH